MAMQASRFVSPFLARSPSECIADEPVYQYASRNSEVPCCLVYPTPFHEACFFSHPYSAEDSKQANDVWLKGHVGKLILICRAQRIAYRDSQRSSSDYTSISILWSQPISALQIKSPDGEWRWVRHVENALVRTSPTHDDWRLNTRSHHRS